MQSLKKNKFFSNNDLYLLFVPLIIEQGLEYIVGLADSIMVAKVGEAAVSGVSLVDSVMACLSVYFLHFQQEGQLSSGSI